MRKQSKINKIRYYRRLLNWTQEQLAEAVGSRYQYIGRYERGMYRTPKDLQEKIASVLGLPVKTIFPENVELAEPEVLDEKTRNRTI
jgi:transcriptional regulator with XRE-family HTH domain